jgi:hypothetical protein
VRRIVICPFGPFATTTARALYRPAMGLSTRPCKGLCGGEFEIARDLDAPLDGAGDGARIRVDSQHALYLLAVTFVCGEVEGLLDPLLLPQTHASQLPLREEWAEPRVEVALV